MSKQLTARGVKMMLTRDGVDMAGLEITERVQTSRRVDVDYTGPWETKTTVVITAAKEARRAARNALAERGLWCAGYPEHDIWSR